MRRLAPALFALLLGSAPALAQSYDQTYEPTVAVDFDASIYTDVDAAPIGEEIPDVSVFYDRLSPYGTWTDDSIYGYVFAPSDPNYVPYSNGYWKLTDFGWTWIAADQHGWATGHYGRWVWRNRWVWRPDTTWGPAWVQWRESDNVVGWAPLGYDVNAYVPDTHWRFIPTVYITSTNVSNYYVRADIPRYVRDTRPIVRWNRHADRRWVAGPDRAYLERHQVRVARATYQPREIGRLDAQERRQADLRAAQLKVKYQARINRDAQVRTHLERKRVEVERRQVEQQRQRVRTQSDRNEQQKKQLDQRAEQVKQREVQQRERAEQQREQAKKQLERTEQAKRATEQRNEQAKKQVEQREQAKRATEQRYERQVEQREQAKRATEQRNEQAKRQVEQRKQAKRATEQRNEQAKRQVEQREQAKRATEQRNEQAKRQVEQREQAKQQRAPKPQAERKREQPKPRPREDRRK